MNVLRVLSGAAWSMVALAAAAQQPIAYPAKGQNQQQQAKDGAECQAWARQTTGVDPMALASAGASQPPPPQPGGERVRGALGGAVIGSVVGGDSEGAAAGAVVGTMAGGMRQRERQRAAAQQQQATQQQMQSQISTFNRAYAACMSGRGYSIQ